MAEGTDMDAVPSQRIDQLLRLRMTRQSEQQRSTQNRKAGRDQHLIEPLLIGHEPRRRRLQPGIVVESGTANF